MLLESPLFLLPFFFFFLNRLQDNLPGVALPKVGWVLPHRLRKCPTAGYYGGILSIEVPLFQMTLACVKLT